MIRSGTTIAIPGVTRRIKVKRVTRRLAADSRVIVKIRLSKKAQRALSRALRRKHIGLATVKVSAVDSAGGPGPPEAAVAGASLSAPPELSDLRRCARMPRLAPPPASGRR